MSVTFFQVLLQFRTSKGSRTTVLRLEVVSLSPCNFTKISFDCLLVVCFACVAKKKSGNVRLYQAAINGDWKTAKSIIDKDSSALTMKINDEGDTALHIAVAKKHISFVENLVQLISSSDLTVKNEKGNTALAIASASGAVKMAEVMVDKNPTLPNLRDSQNSIPLLVAITYKHGDMISFLFSKTNFEALDAFEQFELLIASISIDCYGLLPSFICI